MTETNLINDNELITASCNAICVGYGIHSNYIFVGTNTKPAKFIVIDDISRACKVIAEGQKGDGGCISIRYNNQCLYARIEDNKFLRIDLISHRICAINEKEYDNRRKK